MSGLQLDHSDALQTRAGFVAQAIRESIRRGKLEPGQKLDQLEIANLLNVSRSPVREALQTLAAEGLVTVYPHRGAVVTELTIEELEEIYLIRKALEGLAVYLSVPHIDDGRIAKMEAVLEELEAATDREEWTRLNLEFHHTIYLAIERPRLLSFIQRLRNIAAPYIRQYIASAEHSEVAKAEHRLIFEACVERNAARARKETQKHLDSVLKGTLALMKSEMSTSTDTS